MKKQLLITSVYVKNEAGENMLKSVLRPLMHDFDICLVTHSPVSKELQSMVKYYIYDHRNEMIYPSPSFHIWVDCPSFYFKSYHVSKVPNHSYAAYRSYCNAVRLLENYYEDFIYIEGDCIFSKEDVEKLKEFKEISKKENKSASFFIFPEMLSNMFFYSKMDFFKNTFPEMKTPEEYVSYCEKIGSWKSLENFMFKCAETKNVLSEIYNLGQQMGYFSTSKIGVSSAGEEINEDVGSSYVVVVENTNELAFVYICEENCPKESIDVFLDNEKIYTIPAGPYKCAFKINPTSESFSIKIGRSIEKKYNKTSILNNKDVSFVRLK